MVNPAAADHALVCTVMEFSNPVVALASADSELHITFPSSVTMIEAVNFASVLHKALLSQIHQLFQQPEK